MSGPTGFTTLSHPFVQTDPERASCVNKTDSNNAENETRGIDAAGSGFRSVIRLKLTDRSWCLLRRRARREPMGRNRCGRRMGHRRVRNIDFTVNLIYPLLSRCPVSRRTRKKKPRPINKVLSSRLSPGQHLQTAVVLLHETIGSISQGVFRGFLTIPIHTKELRNNGTVWMWTTNKEQTRSMFWETLEVVHAESERRLLISLWCLWELA